MNLLEKLKGFLPPSSRSFHAMYAEMGAMHAELAKLHDIHADIERLTKTVEVADAHLQTLAFQNYRKDGESYDEARTRFFHELPKAGGDLRLVQLACLQLMRDFDALCRDNGLAYWMSSGTLLGAVRHGGFIPWDDDIDLGMPRADVEKLIDLLSDNDRFIATELFDYRAHSRQVRFRYRDEEIPCFLDLFIFDFATVAPRRAFELMQRDRKNLLAMLAEDGNLSSWNFENQYCAPSTADGMVISAYFDGIIESEYGDGGFLTSDPSQAQAVVWAVDNVDSFTGRPLYFSYEAIFPIGEIEFENDRFLAPNDPESALDTLFGDYLSLPGDIKTRAIHVPGALLEDGSVKEALLKLANTRNAR